MKPFRLIIPHGTRVPDWMEKIEEVTRKGIILKGYCLGFVKRKRDTVVIVGF